MDLNIFYTALATVAATLLGLLFIAIQQNMERARPATGGAAAPKGALAGGEGGAAGATGTTGGGRCRVNFA